MKKERKRKTNVQKVCISVGNHVTFCSHAGDIVEKTFPIYNALTGGSNLSGCETHVTTTGAQCTNQLPNYFKSLSPL